MKADSIYTAYNTLISLFTAGYMARNVNAFHSMRHREPAYEID